MDMAGPRSVPGAAWACSRRWVAGSVKAGSIAAATIAALAAVAGLALHMFPAALDIHVLSDGKRTLTFVEMSHVGSAAYFGRIRDRIRLEGEKGATYLYEGVRGTSEEVATLSPLIGFEEGSGSYAQWRTLLARVAGLESQPQASFLGLTGRPDINADLSASGLIRALAEAGARPRKRDPDLPDYDAVETEIRGYGILDPGTIAHGASRFFLRALLKLNIAGLLPGKLSVETKAAFRKRDDILVGKVLETSGNLVVTYGAAHYDALRELLGPSWKLVATERNPVIE